MCILFQRTSSLHDFVERMSRSDEKNSLLEDCYCMIRHRKYFHVRSLRQRARNAHDLNEQTIVRLSNSSRGTKLATLQYFCLFEMAYCWKAKFFGLLHSIRMTNIETVTFKTLPLSYWLGIFWKHASVITSVQKEGGFLKIRLCCHLCPKSGLNYLSRWLISLKFKNKKTLGLKL